MTAPQIVRLPNGRMAIQTLGGVNATAGNLGIAQADDISAWNLPEPQAEPVYTEEEVRRAHQTLADPTNPAYAKDRKFVTDGGRYAGLTVQQRMAMEEMEAAMEVGEITDLGAYADITEIPSDLRVGMAGSIAGDDAAELAAMQAYDAAEEAGQDPTITGLYLLRHPRAQAPTPPLPPPPAGGNIYD